MIDYPKPAYLCMTACGGIPTDLSDGVGKVYNLCRVKSIRIAASSDMDGWSGCCLTQCQVLVLQKVFSEKGRNWCRLGVLRGYCRGTEVIRSTCRVLPKVESGHVRLTEIHKEGGHVWLTPALLLKWVSPFPRAFSKDDLSKSLL
jgi:hypothetical protein